jgi:transcriptional regulator with XRE-family HTH domain
MLKLKNFREDNDYTQEDIAKILNCKQNTYQQYESEKRQIPIDALKKLALLYNTSIDYLVGLTSEIKPYPRINDKITF